MKIGNWKLKIRNPHLIGLLLAAGALAADQISKTVTLAADGLPGLLSTSWHEREPITVALTATVAGALLMVLTITSHFRHPGVYLMLGAGASNLLDYLRHGAIMNIVTIGRLHLNIADILVVIGAVWLLTEERKA